ncbi:MAG: hypothetical protein ACKN9W_14640 [Methylococcus sp.]
MAEWYRIDLSSLEQAGGEAEIIESAFRQIYYACNAPSGMALLSAVRPRGEGLSLYVTPDSLPHAWALVRAYSAVPDLPPTQTRLQLRVGDSAFSMGHARAF